jgi:hypothetical protein
LDFLRNRARIDDSPTPGNATVKGAPFTGMKNLGIRFRARVGDHIDRGRIALVRQIPAIQKNGESVGLSKSRAETQQRITIGKKRVRLRNFFTKARAVFMRVQTCSVIFREVSEPVASPVTVTSAVSAGLFEISAACAV